ncbi:MAG TPA: hypothetical protein VD993_01950 [Chitinophagaceae bacterium]|nr:hypothetical protein [Chitinophagaceae bacterium]
MRAAFTLLVFVALGFAANAQLSLTPKVGIEPSNTSISYNDLRCLSPLGSYVSPQIGLRMDYKFKKTHGPYLALATNRSSVAMRFDDLETGMNNYSAVAGSRQIRIEGGYMFSTKPIYFNKSASKKSESKQSAKQGKSGCSKYARSGCGSKSKNAPALAKNKNNGWNVRIQPSAGIAFNPGNRPNLEANKNGALYQYNAGNWKTALTAGTDFEFGRGRDRVLTVGFQYIQALGNFGDETITTQAGGKSSTTYLSSNASMWNVTVGVPFTLSRKASASKQKQKQREIKVREIKKQCIYYRPCRGA